MKDHDTWPVFWPSAAEGLGSLGWLPREGGPDALVDKYMTFKGIVDKLDRPPIDVEKAFAYLKPHPFVGLDPVLAARLEEATALRSQWNQKKGEYADPEVHFGGTPGTRCQRRRAAAGARAQGSALGSPRIPLEGVEALSQDGVGECSPVQDRGAHHAPVGSGRAGSGDPHRSDGKGLARDDTRRPPESTPAGYPQEIADVLEAALPEKLQFIRVARVDRCQSNRTRWEERSGMRCVSSPVGYGWPEAQHRDVGIAEDATEPSVVRSPRCSRTRSP